jgi:hypothetical protein
MITKFLVVARLILFIQTQDCTALDRAYGLRPSSTNVASAAAVKASAAPSIHQGSMNVTSSRNENMELLPGVNDDSSLSGKKTRRTETEHRDAWVQYALTYKGDLSSASKRWEPRQGKGNKKVKGDISILPQTTSSSPQRLSYLSRLDSPIRPTSSTMLPQAPTCPICEMSVSSESITTHCTEREHCEAGYLYVQLTGVDFPPDVKTWKLRHPLWTKEEQEKEDASPTLLLSKEAVSTLSSPRVNQKRMRHDHASGHDVSKDSRHAGDDLAKDAAPQSPKRRRTFTDSQHPQKN